LIKNVSQPASAVGSKSTPLGWQDVVLQWQNLSECLFARHNSQTKERMFEAVFKDTGVRTIIINSLKQCRSLGATIEQYQTLLNYMANDGYGYLSLLEARVIEGLVFDLGDEIRNQHRSDSELVDRQYVLELTLFWNIQRMTCNQISGLDVTSIRSRRTRLNLLLEQANRLVDEGMLDSKFRPYNDPFENLRVRYNYALPRRNEVVYGD
jgi:hypothetical protein